MLRECTVCHELKALDSDNFSVKRANKNGYDTRCKVCKKQYDSERYTRDKAKISEQKKSYYQKNKEKLKQKQLEYHRLNLEKKKVGK